MMWNMFYIKWVFCHRIPKVSHRLVVVIINSGFTLILGELVPKQLSISKPEAIARRVSRPTVRRPESSSAPEMEISSHEPNKASQRMAFNGYCLVLVQADKEAGEIRLKAFSEKLKGNEVLISVK